MTSLDDPTATDSKIETKPYEPADFTPVSVPGEPTNPALQEPDAAAILRKGATTATSVTHDRKQELLVQARVERCDWIRQVPLPYASARDPTNVWSTHDRLYPVQSSIGCRKMPVIAKVLSELYGLERQIRTPESLAERVDQLIQPFLVGRSASSRPDFDEEHLIEEVEAQNDEAIRLYYQFWSSLLKPECALLVQGMRNFLGNLQDADMGRLASALKSFVDSTTSSALPSHPSWRNQDISKVKRSLESFLYGQAQPILDRLEWTGLFAMEEEEWINKISQLQFVQAEHLEIQCLNETSALADDLLRDSVRAMVSIDQYYSPYEKLQRILLVYQGVNSALSVALSDHHSDSTSGDRKLPSADDVLPTIILTVLKAKPTRLLRNLQFIEVFAPQEYLRGEAGYAYTNLYGAVQFLQELNMTKPDSLSISAEDFKKGLEESVKKTQEHFELRKTPVGPDHDLDVISMDISANDVRQARLKGETINLEWAINHGLQHPEKCEFDGHSVKTNALGPLPVGFTRSYAYLSASPQDIRLSDLPKLLAEYKMMAHVTEQLLAERGARIATEKKKKDRFKSRQLDDSFFGISTSDCSQIEHDTPMGTRS